jgi:sec-independent protein translocase protein TatC
MHYLSHYFFEIRLRIIYTIIASILSLFVSYLYKYEIFYLFSKPFLVFSNQFIFLDLTEGLYSMIRISGIISIITTIPYIIYQIWSFLIPSYYLYERQKFNKILMIFGIAFCIEFFFIYWILFPKFCEFLVSFEIKSLISNHNNLLVSIEFSPRIESYIKLTTQLFSFLLFIFQFPLIFFILFIKKLISSYTLCEQRKIYFFFSILVSALFSPPDFLSQLLLSSILYIFYEFIIFIGFFLNK